MTFAFDPDMESGKRIIESSVKIGGQNLEHERVSDFTPKTSFILTVTIK